MYLNDAEMKSVFEPNHVNDGFARNMTVEERDHYANEHKDDEWFHHVPTYVSRLWNADHEVFHYNERDSRHAIGDYGV